MNTITNKRKLLVNLFISGIIILNTPLAIFATELDTESANSVEKAQQYIESQQASDGSIDDTYGKSTEWSVIAIVSTGKKPQEIVSNEGNSTVDALKNDTPSSGASATTIEKKILAINAAKENSENFGHYNYLQQLKNKEIDNQIGDVNAINDDIFGVLAIESSNKTELNQLGQKALDYFISKQKSDGGFSYSALDCDFCGSDSNDTAAAIMAMYAAERMGLTNVNMITSKDNAIVYLLSTQQADGGFSYDLSSYSVSDASSTAWGLMALNVMGAPYVSQAKNARSWLVSNQYDNGAWGYSYGGDNFSDTATTAHAIIALMGSTWTLNPTPYTLAFSTTNEQEIEKNVSNNVGESVKGHSVSNVDPITTNKQQTTIFTSITSDSLADVNSTSDDTNTAKNNSEVLAATDSLNQDKSSEKTNANNQVIQIAAIIGLITAALGWFLLQSKQGKKE
jgi:hypothetical protein